MREFTPEEIKELLEDSMYSWESGRVEHASGGDVLISNVSIVTINNRPCIVRYYESLSTREISIPSQVPDLVKYVDKTETKRHWSYADGRGHLVSYKISD